jgi:caffeoyl-CoA O-methyltransferase
MNDEYFIKAENYISELFVLNDTVLAATLQSVQDAGIHDIGVSPSQGKLLQLLARLCGAKKILEMGTFFGYSGIWLARALPADGQLITLEYDPQNAAFAEKNFKNAGLQNKIQIRTGNALEILPQLEAEGAGPFDMIFIDADKPPYAEYFRLALRLSRPGTLIIADNVVRHVFDPATPEDKKNGVIRFNQLIAESDAVSAVILQTVGSKEPDGMAIAIVN